MGDFSSILTSLFCNCWAVICAVMLEKQVNVRINMRKGGKFIHIRLLFMSIACICIAHKWELSVNFQETEITSRKHYLWSVRHPHIIISDD